MSKLTFPKNSTPDEIGKGLLFLSAAMHFEQLQRIGQQIDRIRTARIGESLAFYSEDFAKSEVEHHAKMELHSAKELAGCYARTIKTSEQNPVFAKVVEFLDLNKDLYSEIHK